MKLLVLLIALLVTIVLLMVVFERSLIFFPTRYPTGNWDVVEVARGTGYEIEDCRYESEDGTRLHSWLCRNGTPDKHRPVLLLFHGNAGNLSDRAGLMLELARLVEVDVFIAGYRGYGRCEGRPSEEGLYADARAAWRWLTSAGGYAPDRIVVFGKSLGGAVAVDLATEVDPAGLIVESSFTSIPEMAARHYPFVPTALIRTRMDSRSKIGDIGCPKLFIHSQADEVVPFEFGQRLYEDAAEPKDFFEVVGAGHNETWLVGGADYFRAVRRFVESVT